MTTTTETLTKAGRSIGYNGGLTVAMQVKDLAASIDWYQNVVGFKLLYQVEDIGWCELSTSVDKVNLGLSQVEKPKIGGPTPTFGVNDIAHARKTLEKHGVRFDGETQEIPGMVKLATFFDPDGNSLMYYESLSSDVP
jgi:catechol 2,3-dioxygenase-like lactoylglutathione lyase family enzyme